MEFLEHLAQEIERTGHTVRRGESFFIIEPIQLKIECEMGERAEHHTDGPYSVIITLSIKATHDGLFPEGIWDCLAGIGASDDEAFAYAAQGWTEGVFAPIHEILVPVETVELNVERLDVIVTVAETGEEIPWKFYLGALQIGGEFLQRQDTLDAYALFNSLFQAIPSVLRERRLIWIKTFIARSPDGSIEGDCWLNNHDWAAGLNTLHGFAKEWQDVTSFAYMKQFLIVRPCAWSEISDVTRLRKALPVPKKPGFFSRWFSRQ